MKIIENDVIFLSFDEPNANENYADLCKKVPWAKRVHGVKGSDAAHKEAARQSDTEWFVTVDADNIVDTKFFSLDVNTTSNNYFAYCWSGRNQLNGLEYGNGGLKLWNRDYVANMKSHEESECERDQVDFCWQTGYKSLPESFSSTIITGSPFQAWRAGFREGVKMTLDQGVKVSNDNILSSVWWENVHRLKIWSSVGAHVTHGIYAVLGARMGIYKTNCTDWEYIKVRDFDELANIFNNEVAVLTTPQQLETAIEFYKTETNKLLKVNWPVLPPDQSQYVYDLYTETVKFSRNYFSRT